MPLSRDPNPIVDITYEVQTVTGGYRVERLADNGSEASLYRTGAIGSLEFAQHIAATCAAAEGGTVIE